MVDATLSWVLVDFVIQVSLLTVLAGRKHQFRHTDLCIYEDQVVAPSNYMKDLDMAPRKLYARPGSGPW